MAVAKKEESLLPKLIESNLALQKKFVELIGSFQEMTKKLDRMLTLFEEAGRKITEVEILSQESFLEFRWMSLSLFMTD